MRTRTNHRPISALIIALTSLGTACAGSDGTANTPGTTSSSAPVTSTSTPVTAPPTTAADTDATSDSTSQPTDPPTSGSDTVETPAPSDTTSPMATLEAFEPPAELGAGYTQVEGEGTPPPTAAWTAMEALGDCDGVEPLWNVASTDKLAARNLQFLGASPTDLRSLVVFVLTDEGASRVWQSFAAAPSQVATCWQEGVRVLTGIGDFTIVDTGGPIDPVPAASISWRYQDVSSATFGFQASQAFGMIRHGDVVAWVSLPGATSDTDVAAILTDIDTRLADITG